MFDKSWQNYYNLFAEDCQPQFRGVFEKRHGNDLRKTFWSCTVSGPLCLLEIAPDCAHIVQVGGAKRLDAPPLLGKDDPVAGYLEEGEDHQEGRRAGKERHPQKADKIRHIHWIAGMTPDAAGAEKLIIEAAQRTSPPA